MLFHLPGDTQGAARLAPEQKLSRAPAKMIAPRADRTREIEHYPRGEGIHLVRAVGKRSISSRGRFIGATNNHSHVIRTTDRHDDSRDEIVDRFIRNVRRGLRE